MTDRHTDIQTDIRTDRQDLPIKSPRRRLKRENVQTLGDDKINMKVDFEFNILASYLNNWQHDLLCLKRLELH